MSNIGAVAARDAYSGAISWLDIYRDRSALTVQGFLPMGAMGGGALPDRRAPAGPWTFNPAAVHNGKLFILPSDSPYLLVYDADTGAELKRLWLDDLLPGDGDTNRPNTFLAVDDVMMYLANASWTWQIPWQEYDHGGNHQPRGYRASVSTGADSRDVRGHAFVTGDAVYLPMSGTMQRILLKTGMIDPKDGTFPRNGWERADEGPGNVLVTDDYLIVAGEKQVAVYTDLGVARQKLDREIAARR